MTTTDQRSSDPATSAGPAAWVVPGVDLPTPRNSENWSRSGQAAADGHTADGGPACDGWAAPGVDAIPAPDQRATSRETPDEVEPMSAAGNEQDTEGWRDRLDQASGPDAGQVHPVIAALATCLEALDGVRDAGVGTLSARELRLMLLAVVHLIGAAFALKLKLVAAGEVQRVADLTGARSTATFLATLTRANRPDAAGEVRLAKDLDVRYSVLAAAAARGAVTAEQLRVCVSALRRLPKDTSVAKLEEAQRFLIHAACEMSPRELKIVGRRLWEVIDPDGADEHEGKALKDEEEQAHARAYFKSWRNGDGTTGFRGKLPDAHADMLLKLLHAHANPRRRANPNIPTSQPDNQSPKPSASSEPPACQPDGSSRDPGDDQSDEPAGSSGMTGAGDGGCTGSPRDGCLDEASPEEAETGKTLPYPVRLGHALIDLVERIPRAAVPDAGGIAATIVVTIREEQLRTGLGAATLDTGTPVSAAQARRWACEAGLIPAVLGGASQPLDVGREQRLHTKAMRIAIHTRQAGACALEGCEHPITAYHHPHSWASGGATSVRNGLGLCGYHHHLAHQPTWNLVHTNGSWSFERPSRSPDSDSG